MVAKVDGTNGLLQAYDYQVLTTGFTYTFAAGTQLLLAVPAGTLATGTVTMPASPADGMNITITSTQQITALTVNGNTGQSIVGGTTSVSAGGSQTFVYRLANTTWYSQNNNALAPPGTQGQVFTSSGTFTIPTGVTAVKVTVVGGGGAANNNGSSGGGGGAAIKYLTGLTPGGTLTVTRGAAGGTSSVASGTQSISTISATGGGVLTAGVGSGGDLNISGQGGSGASNSSLQGGVAGGSSILGGGGRAVSSGAGAAGGNYGGGGAAGAYAGCSSYQTGGAGAAGVVVFEW
jgi:hypothetical protein